MNLQSGFFVPSVIVFLLTTVGLVAWFVHRERRSRANEWDVLAARLQAVDRELISRIAIANGEVPDTEMYDAIGLAGLKTLERNCEVLVELATYVQRWHPEAIVVAEELRLSGRELKWHVDRLRGAELAGRLEETFGDYADRAIRVYHGMTGNLLRLYQRLGDPHANRLKMLL